MIETKTIHTDLSLGSPSDPLADLGTFFPHGSRSGATHFRKANEILSAMPPARSSQAALVLLGHLQVQVDEMVRSVVLNVVVNGLGVDESNCTDDMIVIEPQHYRAYEQADEIDICFRLEQAFDKRIPLGEGPFREDREDSPVETFGELVAWVKDWLRSTPDSL